MKIAMFTDAYYPRINGVTVSVHSYATELVKLGHDVVVVCLEYSEEQQKNSLFDAKSGDKKSPFKIVRLPSAPLWFSKEDRMMKLHKWYKIKQAMSDFEPDVIHINSEWTVGYMGALYAFYKHIPSVYTFHTMWEDYLANYVTFLPPAMLHKIGRDVVKFYLKKADEIIAPTNMIAKVAEHYGIEKPIDILPTGIPDSKCVANAGRLKKMNSALFKKFPQLKGKRILLYAGRVVKEKNLLFLYDVLEKVKKECPKTALLFVGNGIYEDELKEIATERGLTDSVAFTGYIPSDDMVYFYKMASVFAFPSKTETQGLVTIEAMLSGLPVVAIGEMGTVNVMQGDNGGFMVKEDVEEFSARVTELLKDRKLLEQKSKEAVLWAQKWKISNLTPQLVKNYENAIKTCARKRQK